MNASHWSEVSERGSVRALRFAAWAHRHLGRAPMRVLLRCASLYFFAFAPGVRRASRSYLERIWQRPDARAALRRAPGPRSVIAHIYSFATSVYDRMVVLGGELDAYQIEHDRSGEIFALAREKRGALLLGAHLGSFELLWYLSRKYDLAINVVAYFENAARINGFLDSLDPGTRVRAIGLDPSSVRSAFEIRACIERGEFVVILADRVPPGERARCAQAAFLGASAAFPIGPFELAGVLDCPVSLALCVRTGEGRYRTVLRPLRDAARIARAERDARARELLLGYVAALESYCTRFPYEWFNFFDFWGESSERAA